jgi:hypothetical protein
MTEEADIWRDFQGQFMQLAYEEERTPGARRELKIDLGTTVAVEQIKMKEDRLLRAYCDYKEHPVVWEKGKPKQGCFCLLKAPETGLWTYSDGVSENFQARSRALISRVGLALGSPKDTDPEDFWLHRLYHDLLENNSDQLFAASREGGVILRVSVASATFCARLERQAITRADRLRTDEKQAESSRAQRSTNSPQDVGNKPTSARFGVSVDALSEIEETVYNHLDSKALMIGGGSVWKELRTEQSSPLLADIVAREAASRLRPLFAEAACEYVEMLTRTIVAHQKDGQAGRPIHWKAIADRAVEFCATLTRWEKSARWLYGPLKAAGLGLQEDVTPRTVAAFLTALSAWMLLGPYAKPPLSTEPVAEGIREALRRKIRHIVRLAPGKELQRKSEDRRAMVDAYIEEVRNKRSKRITRKDIWARAGYKSRTEFERWERQDPKHPNKAADENFARILREKPHLK